jgi:hypothetical protein
VGLKLRDEVGVGGLGKEECVAGKLYMEMEWNWKRIEVVK